MLQGLIRILEAESGSVGRQLDNGMLGMRANELRANAENAKQDQPFEDRMKRIAVQIQNVKQQMAALGMNEEAQVAAKAFESANTAIEEVNKALEHYHKTLTPAQEKGIRLMESILAQDQADEQWTAHMQTATTQANLRVTAVERLTAAIGKGYEATRQANIETRVAAELGEKAFDAKWMAAHSGDVDKIRGQVTKEVDADHGQRVGQNIERLNDEIALEKELAEAQSSGAEAVRQAAFTMRLAKLAEEGATKDQIEAEIELFQTQRDNRNEQAIGDIQQRIDATERLTAAILKGAAAEREVERVNQEIKMAREGLSPEAIAKQRDADESERRRQVLAQAAAPGMNITNRLDLIGEEVAALNKAREVRGDTLAIEVSLRELENERLRLLVEESLNLRHARDGVRAFFIEMQEDAKSAARVIYDAMNGALDLTSRNAAKAVTGQKTAWAKELQGLGEEMMQSTIKSGLQRTLGAAGKLFGVDLTGAVKADGSKGNPFWVRVAEGGALGGRGSFTMPDGLPLSIPGMSNAGPVGGLFGSGGLGKIFSFFSKALPFAGFLAEGGEVEPGYSYAVGEEGPERFTPAMRGTISPAGSTTINNIDARGADLGAANRINRVMDKQSKMTTAQSVRATHERAMRVPKS